MRDEVPQAGRGAGQWLVLMPGSSPRIHLILKICMENRMPRCAHRIGRRVRIACDTRERSESMFTARAALADGESWWCALHL